MTSDLRVLERPLLDAHIHSARAAVAQTLKSEVTAISGGISF
ncbi:MAG: hypothetical protein ABIG67_07510 [Pseudomonadota bacterium]